MDLAKQAVVRGQFFAPGALLLLEGVAQLEQCKGHKRAWIATAVDLFIDQDQSTLRGVLGQLGQDGESSRCRLACGKATANDRARHRCGDPEKNEGQCGRLFHDTESRMRGRCKQLKTRYGASREGALGLPFRKVNVVPG